jgi:catechol 2,3-dioxygenase-like lactoylglutathione lyase family enzyme
MKKTALILTAILYTVLLQAQEKASFTISLDHIALCVKDLDRSANFYKKVMKLEEITNKTKIEGIRWFTLADGKELHLISIIKENITINKAVHLGLTTTKFEDFIKILEDQKIIYSDWPDNQNTINTRTDGVHQIFFQDPDGYWIEINDVSKK